MVWWGRRRAERPSEPHGSVVGEGHSTSTVIQEHGEERSSRHSGPILLPGLERIGTLVEIRSLSAATRTSSISHVAEEGEGSIITGTSAERRRIGS